jgi:ABC-type bacteriocin/lantibiotic exporter with double-glycine peptidase domain
LRFIYSIKSKKPNYLPGKIISKKNINELKFNKNFLLRKITFGYSVDNIILNNLNFFIKKNEKILILGQSGSGKSTLIDIITGLIKAKNGYLKVDNFIINERNLHLFQNYVSLVPQEVFLAETSFLKNISLGNSLKDIDIKKVRFCAKIAEIDSFISKTKHGYNTIVSYNGSNLSGGQKQRIGIARALYKGADILIFDESTSAIDDKTEEKIFNNFKIILKNKTIIFVSHKKKNIKYFDKVYNLSNGKLKRKIL